MRVYSIVDRCFYAELYSCLKSIYLEIKFNVTSDNSIYGINSSINNQDWG